MFKKILLFTFATIFFAAFSPDKPSAKSNKRQAYDRGLIVYASPSLTNILHKALKEYSESQNIAMSASFDSSYYLAEKIEDGAAANILIIDNPKIMKDLQQKGLINVFSLTNIAADSMAIIAPKGHYLTKKLKKYDTTKDKLRFLSKNSLIFVPDVKKEDIGVIFKEYIKKLGFWKNFRKSIIKAENSREAIFLASKAKNLALVHKSDLKHYKNFEVVVDIPEDLHKKIVYQAAIVADLVSDKNTQDAENFIKFLKSGKYKQYIVDNGFSMI